MEQDSVMKNKRYDEEFKRNAVEMLFVGGRPLKNMAATNIFYIGFV